jgi:hypothetical protein
MGVTWGHIFSKNNFLCLSCCHFSLSAGGQILPRRKNAFGNFILFYFCWGEQMETLFHFIFGKKWIS